MGDEIKCGTFTLMGDWSFGGILRCWRLSKNPITLRRAAELARMDAGNYSKLERNILAPPKSKKAIDKLIERMDITPFDTQRLYEAAFNFHFGSLSSRFK